MQIVINKILMRVVGFRFYWSRDFEMNFFGFNGFWHTFKQNFFEDVEKKNLSHIFSFLFAFVQLENQVCIFNTIYSCIYLKMIKLQKYVCGYE